jgi:hypothetical protein
LNIGESTTLSTKSLKKEVVYDGYFPQWYPSDTEWEPRSGEFKLEWKLTIKSRFYTNINQNYQRGRSAVILGNEEGKVGERKRSIETHFKVLSCLGKSTELRLST